MNPQTKNMNGNQARLMKFQRNRKKRPQEKKNEDPKGIPEFWLTVFQNVDLQNSEGLEHSESILKPLEDIKEKLSDAGQPLSFLLEFHFEPNEYFTNEVLTKISG
jgi:nucleosome assembly protein 1-like 1